MNNRVVTQAERPGLKFQLSFFFFFFGLVQSQIAVRASACVNSHETEPPVARMVSNFQKFSSLKVYGKDSMICRRSIKLDRFSKCSHISTVWCFCTWFFAQNNSIVSLESFSACFCEKQNLKLLGHFAWAIDFPKWRIFIMLSYLDYLVFLHAVFCTEQLCCFCRIIYGMFQEKKVENTLPILNGLQTFENGGFPKCSHISPIWCFCTRFFAQNNITILSLESFQYVFAKKKKVENNFPF